MGFTTSYLAFVNTLAMILGIAIAATGAYVLIAAGQTFPEDFGYSDWQAWVGVVGGIAIFFLSLVACCCETFLQYQTVILCFALIQFGCGLAVLIGGSVVSVFAGNYINTIVSSPEATQGIAPGLGGLQARMSDLLLGLHDGCCNGTVPELQKCPDFQEYSGKHYCFEEIDTYELGIEAGEKGRTNYCTLQDIFDSCPSDIPLFLRKNQILLNVYIWPAGIAFVIFGCLLFVASLCSCRLGLSPIQRAPMSAHEMNAGTVSTPIYHNRGQLAYA